MSEISTTNEALLQEQLNELKLGGRIEKSVKMSRQVVLKNLKETRESLMNQYKEHENSRRLIWSSDEYKAAKKVYNAEVIDAVSKDPEVNTLRLAANLFMYEEDKLESNKDLVHEILPFDNYINKLIDTIKKGMDLPGNTHIGVSLWFSMPSKEQRSTGAAYPDDWNGVPATTYEFTLSEVTKGAATLAYQLKDIEEAKESLNKQINDIDTKINNIDEVMKDIEAKLLMDELAKTEEGQKVLEMAESVIGEVVDIKLLGN